MVISIRSPLASVVFMILAATTCLSQESDPNVALNKWATQSGTYGGRDARRAVDGYLFSLTNSLHCSSADTSDQSYQGDKRFAWWQVDLADTYTVSAVTVYNTDDNEEWRYLFNFAIYVSYVSDVTDSGSRLQCRIVNPTVPVPRNESLAINCTIPRVGRYVTIKRLGGSVPTKMTLCEVEVEGSRYYRCSPGNYGINCAERCPVCPSGFTCNSVTGECCSDQRNCQNANPPSMNSSSTTPTIEEERPSTRSPSELNATSSSIGPASGESRPSIALSTGFGSLVLVTVVKMIEFYGV